MAEFQRVNATCGSTAISSLYTSILDFQHNCFHIWAPAPAAPLIT
jgi:hypothetical protein